MMDDFFFDDLVIPSFSNQWSSPYLALTWRTCLGIAALLDSLATVLPDLLRQDPDDHEDCFQRGGQPHSKLVLSSSEIPEKPWDITIRYLGQNVAYIGFAFSMLCCLEAFMHANEIVTEQF